MKKYIISYGNNGEMYNAGGKAPQDIISILLDQGYQIVSIGYLNRSRLYRWLLIPFYAVFLSCRIEKKSDVLFQHPYDTYHDAIKLINRIAFAVLKRKQCQIYTIVHDLIGLRNDESVSVVCKEIKFLNCFDGVIVHSPQMEKFVLSNGYFGKTSVLGLFDYLVDAQNTIDRTLSKRITFAGNLNKSGFLNGFEHSDELADIEIELYGYPLSRGVVNDSMKYRGMFSSNDLSSIMGSWGLVWDGTSIYGCDGPMGVYLEYNSPHKASLYVCAGLPLIVPSKSAVALIVKEKQLGLVVDSLNDLDRALSAVTEQEYAGYLENVEAESRILMRGGNILFALHSIQQ